MNNIFDNVKVYAVTAVLFAVATLATAGDVHVPSGLTVAPIELSNSISSDSKGAESAKLGPTMPPSPWDEGK